MTACAIYCRISRDPEGQGLGVERQEEDCRKLAGQLGLTVARVYVDNDVSASTLSGKLRKQFEAMMAEVEVGRIGTVLAYSNSRLTRRPLELERLIAAHGRTGVQFRTVVSGTTDLSTADGRAVARTMAAWDAAEAERVSERVRRTQQQMREQGKWHGGHRPYGFEKDGKTVRGSEAAIILEAARGLLGGRSMISLVADLNERGVTTSRGAPWSTRTLLRVLRRPHPATEDIAEAVRALLDDPKRRTTPGPARRWLLSGIAMCGVCGNALTGSGSSLGAGRGTYPAYRCRTGKHVVVSALALDAYISTFAVERLARADARGALPESGNKAEAEELSARAASLRVRLDALADDLEIDERTMARRSKALREALQEAEERYAALMGATALDDIEGDPVEAWEGFTLARQREIIKLLMTVSVGPAARGLVAKENRWREDLPSFDPRRVTVEPVRQ